MQSLIAVGTGGIRGLGLMEGRQKLFYLPEAHTDFIFANVCEELGLIGALALVGLFVALAYRGMRAALSFDRSVCAVHGVRDDFGDSDPGFLQHERGGGSAADQGDHAAVYLIWRDVVCL